MFDIKILSFGYSELLFDRVTLQLESNKIYLLTGANGSGKTTFLRILSGLIRTFQGDVKLKNFSLTELSYEKISNEILYLKQEAAANIVAATPMEDLEIRLTKFNKKSYDKNLIEESLKYFKMYEYKDTPIWKLSSGQMARVGLSSLLLYPEKFWLLDEPLNSLDKGLKQLVLKIVKQKKISGGGAIIVSHNIDYFKPYCDKILKIERKKII